MRIHQAVSVPSLAAYMLDVIAWCEKAVEGEDARLKNKKTDKSTKLKALPGHGVARVVGGRRVRR